VAAGLGFGRRLSAERSQPLSRVIRERHMTAPSAPSWRTITIGLGAVEANSSLQPHNSLKRRNSRRSTALGQILLPRRIVDAERLAG